RVVVDHLVGEVGGVLHLDGPAGVEPDVLRQCLREERPGNRQHLARLRFVGTADKGNLLVRVRLESHVDEPHQAIPSRAALRALILRSSLAAPPVPLAAGAADYGVPRGAPARLTYLSTTLVFSPVGED